MYSFYDDTHSILRSTSKHQQILDWFRSNKIVKSFKLNLSAPTQMTATLTIGQNTNVFHFTNQSGNDFRQTCEVVLEPKHDRKIYIIFNPTDSACHRGLIIVNMGVHRFKVHLFGYAEPAIMKLLDFHPVIDPKNPNKELLVKQCTPSEQGSQIKISVFNSGARTGYVAFFSHQKSVTFQPRTFLLIPKTTKEVVVCSWDTDKPITFFVIHVDEELRRSCRISCAKLGGQQDIYHVFNVLHVFSRLPEEKVMKLQELPDFDWRPHLRRQINTSYCTGIIQSCVDTGTTNDSVSVRTDISSIARPALGSAFADSVCTIDKQTKSSVTGMSSLSNIEDLNSKVVYMNSAASFIRSLHHTLSGVVVLKDVNRFPVTVVNKASHLGILIRNNNCFSVNWFLSQMLLTSVDSPRLPSPSGIVGVAGTAGTAATTDTSSVYSLSSVPLYDTTSSMSAGVTIGTLRPYGATVVPVTFRPRTTGRIECKCSVRLDAIGCRDEMSFEKDIDFGGDAVRQQQQQQYQQSTDISGADSGSVSGVGWGQQRPVSDVSVSPHAIAFPACKVGVRTERNVQVRNKGNHLRELFLSDLERGGPFEVRATRMTVEKGRSQFAVSFQPMTSGSFEAVLVLCDDGGDSTAVLLRGSTC